MPPEDGLKQLLRRARSVLATALMDDMVSVLNPARKGVLKCLITDINAELGDTLPKSWESHPQ